MNSSIKTWATPLAIGSFIISAVTGLLIFFDIEMGAVEPVHKWLGWLLVGGVALHLLANWKAFTGYFSRKPALVITGVAALVTVSSLLPVFGEKEEGGKHTVMAAAGALESSSLETVALVAKKTPEELAGLLSAKGISAVDKSMTLKEIAARNGKESRAVLALLFGDGDGKSDRDGDRD